jgi:hypothetical protein
MLCNVQYVVDLTLFGEQENKKEQLQGTCASYFNRRDESVTMTILEIIHRLSASSGETYSGGPNR